MKVETLSSVVMDGICFKTYSISFTRPASAESARNKLQKHFDNLAKGKTKLDNIAIAQEPVSNNGKYYIAAVSTSKPTASDERYQQLLDKALKKVESDGEKELQKVFKKVLNAVHS